MITKGIYIADLIFKRIRYGFGTRRFQSYGPSVHGAPPPHRAHLPLPRGALQLLRRLGVQLHVKAKNSNIFLTFVSFTHLARFETVHYAGSGI